MSSYDLLFFTIKAIGMCVENEKKIVEIDLVSAWLMALIYGCPLTFIIPQHTTQASNIYSMETASLDYNSGVNKI